MDAQETIEIYTNGLHAGMWFQVVVMCLAALIGIGGNITFIVLFYARKRVQTYANYLYLYRAGADILFLSMVPLYVITVANGEFIYGMSTCWIISCFIQCGVLASNVLLIPIGIHCYLIGGQQKYSSTSRSFFTKVAVRLIGVICGAFVVWIFLTSHVKMSDDGFVMCVEGPLFNGGSTSSILSIFVVMVVPLIGIWLTVVLMYTHKQRTEATTSGGEASGVESQEQFDDATIQAQQRLVVALAITFTVCQVPFWIVHLLIHITSPIVAMLLLCIIMPLIEISMALNPIMYFWHSKELLQELRSNLPSHSPGMVPLD